MAYWRLLYHLVWAVRDRQQLIDPAWERRLYAVIISKATQMGARIRAIGGTADHVHVLVAIPPTQTLAMVVGQMKGSASHFVNHEIVPGYEFRWQGSYGAISLGDKDAPRIAAYIEMQRQHHAHGQVDDQFERSDDEAEPF